MLIVGIGGTLRPGSTSETALRVALDGAAGSGAHTECFSAERLQLPVYDPRSPERVTAARELVEAVRQADGLILSTPSYHGSISGLVKNAIDYLEDLAQDSNRTYLDGLPVGCIAVGHGWQGAVSTLGTLREISHALRAWPTPYGAAINAVGGVFQDGTCTDAGIAESLRLVGCQTVEMALSRRAPDLVAS